MGTVSVSQPRKVKCLMSKSITYESDFTAIDSEGFTDSKGIHNIYMIGRSDLPTLQSDYPLSFRELEKYLTTPTKSRHVVGFAFSYDVTQIIKILINSYPHPQQPYISEMLLEYAREQEEDVTADPENNSFPQVVIPYPNQDLTIGLTIIPSKLFIMKIYKDYKVIRSCKIEDVFSFFQSSFIKALESFHIPVPDEIKSGKEQRENHTVEYWLENKSTVMFYNREELRLLVDLMNKFKSITDRQNLTPKLMIGPGSIASKLLKERYENIAIDMKILDFARRSMVGGWFDIYKKGLITTKSYEYDINSAYPHALSVLPEIRNKHLVFTKDKNKIKKMLSHKDFIFVAFKGSVKHKDNEVITCLPARQVSGKIINPTSITNGIHQGEPFKSALRKDKIEDYTIEQALFLFDDGTRPFEWVEEFYLLRKRLGKDLEGYPIKLALNSLYGKFAQSIGNPKFAHPIIATLITGLTRAKIIDNLSDQVFMIATDAIFASKPLDISISDNLGDFDMKVFKKMLLIQPGFYFGVDEDDKLVKSRSRGMSSKAFKDKTFDDLVDIFLHKDEIKIYRDVLFSWRLSLAQGRLSKMGQFSREPQILKLGGGKRNWIEDVGYPIYESGHEEYERLMGLERITENLFDSEIDDILGDVDFG